MRHWRRVAEAAEGQLQRQILALTPAAEATSASPMAFSALSSMNRSARRTEAGAIQGTAPSKAPGCDCAAARTSKADASVRGDAVANERVIEP